ncbi:hypothetical protein ACSHT0_17105 [Tepidicaulis sp. LMO-SS28]|uniref:hypothetical protein n=1 Tax=Tepidicaulis sp. LMO-SS28 TaxID=3447455 RepID=UPI003EE33502
MAKNNGKEENSFNVDGKSFPNPVSEAYTREQLYVAAEAGASATQRQHAKRPNMHAWDTSHQPAAFPTTLPCADSFNASSVQSISTEDRLTILQAIDKSKVNRGIVKKSKSEPVDRLAPYMDSSFSLLLTVTKDTSEQYVRDAVSLYKAFQQEFLHHSQGDSSGTSASPTNFLEWLIARRDERKWSKQTWRKYRCAVRHWAALCVMQGACGSNETYMITLLSDLSDEHTAPETAEERRKFENSERRGPAKKRRSFRRSDANEIIANLAHECNSIYAEPLLHWLRAGLLTGLRPIEWQATEYVSTQSGSGHSEHYLIVLNAKSTNFRGSGIVRVLDISDMSTSHLESIQYMSDVGYRMYMNGDWKKFYSQCSQLLNRICKTIWPTGKPRCYSLYSCRHQFISNMKAAYDPVTVALLSGHGSYESAQKNYARAYQAWSEALPKPKVHEGYRQIALASNERYREILERKKTPFEGSSHDLIPNFHAVGSRVL